MPEPVHEEIVLHASVYPIAWRFIAAVFYAVSRASLFVIMAMILIGFAISPPLLVRLILAFSLLPGLAAALIRWAFVVDIYVREGMLILHRRGIYRRGLKVEVACEKTERIAPWRIPLPGPGISLWMSSADRRGYSLQTNNPDKIMHAIGAEEEAPADDTTHPSVIYAQAKRIAGFSSWHHIFFKFGIFPLLPAIILFRLHQYVAHGGMFGQYYLHGLQPYLSTFAYYWIIVLIYLLLYASIWRALSEVASLLAAHYAPSRAVMVRRWSERGIMILYYGGVPVLMAMRFL